MKNILIKTIPIAFFLISCDHSNKYYWYDISLKGNIKELVESYENLGVDSMKVWFENKAPYKSRQYINGKVTVRDKFVYDFFNNKYEKLFFNGKDYESSIEYKLNDNGLPFEIIDYYNNKVFAILHDIYDQNNRLTYRFINYPNGTKDTVQYKYSNNKTVEKWKGVNFKSPCIIIMNDLELDYNENWVKREKLTYFGDSLDEKEIYTRIIRYE
ncbi:hypothetical protein EI427_21575 [Flammeovirga pectinis]|uniref:Lipoprotein n=1 Tax=Flammeovirga pectinis TaxID=2494373 RepID=A0A3S9P9D1_9BACT|nr:hypothetical protein [Flammeovirga pectinis]AZQ64818.1 hypothetical protein EI427_21575 [Flammeovirga pectinis]